MRRKNTESLRATLSQEFRLILPPELGVDVNACRKITLLFAPSPDVSLVIFPYTVRVNENYTTYNTLEELTGATETISNPQQLGLNRHYKAPTWSIHHPVDFELLANQSIAAAAKNGMIEFAYLVEYI